MSTPTRKFHVLFAVASLALLAILTSACAFIPHSSGDFTQEITVTIDKEMLTKSQPSFKVNNHNFWEDLDVDVDRMELHDGYLRFLGIKVMPDGSIADCSMDVNLGAENGSLTAEIIALDIPGVTVSDASVLKINQEMEVLIHSKVFVLYPASELKFLGVEVTEGELQITVEVTVSI